MEVVFLLGLFGAIFLAFRLGRSRSTSRTLKPTPTPTTQTPSIKRVAANTAKAQSSHFDAGSVKHLHDKRVLTGAAYVTDGDTIKINKTQVRLFGIDAPEMNHPYGKKAKWALHKLCKDQIVRAEITDVDDHGRTVAHCYLQDGRDLSAEMVKQGLAIDWPKFSGGKYRDLETSDARKKLFLADARQKGRMQIWEKFEAKQGNQ